MYLINLEKKSRQKLLERLVLGANNRDVADGVLADPVLREVDGSGEARGAKRGERRRP